MSVTPAQLRSGYGPIYRHLSRCGDSLTPASKLVLLNLLERLGQKGMVWPSQETISGDTGFSDTTIRKALGELSALGFIAQHRRGRGQTNEYTVAIDVVLAWAEKGKNLRTEDPPSREPIEHGDDLAQFKADQLDAWERRLAQFSNRSDSTGYVGRIGVEVLTALRQTRAQAEALATALRNQGLLQNTFHGTVWHVHDCPASFDFAECHYRCRVAREAFALVGTEPYVSPETKKDTEVYE